MVSRLSLRLSNYSGPGLEFGDFERHFPVDGLGASCREPVNAVSNCGGSLVAVPGSTSLDLNGGSVPARDGGSRAAGAVVQLDVVGPAGTYDNTAVTQAVQNNADGSTTQVQASDDARLIYTGVLTAAKSFNPTSSGRGALHRQGNADQ